ncbi:MAG: valine--tRNA ligase, partial [Elusimicrobiota bacterium]|nr:valine--tRNA ligase [Elusimicrobiota bacterium]
EFGTGAVKVTPGHDPADFEIAQRHKLEVLKVINEDGKMINVGKYTGLDRFECRKVVVEDLQQLGLLQKTEDYVHNIGVCYRCGSVIEPLTSQQWFIRMREIADRAYEAIKQGKVKYYPEIYKDYTLNWLENIKDWCISRQIWWGHRIPVWYCENFKKESQMTKCQPIVSEGKPEKCQYCNSTELYQDPDVLDTWFSSALWPFSVFGWGVIDEEVHSSQLTVYNKKELTYYYPTQILVTGYEILYLWVARMIMMGLHFLNEVPFKEVFVHGIVRDIHGKKMSKSLGNVIDPLEIVEKYGTDALRFSLVSSTTAGRDIHLAEESFVLSRNFMNKLYNMTRFILMNLQEIEIQQLKDWLKKPIYEHIHEFGIAEHWIISELQMLVSTVNQLYNNYLLGNIAHEIYEFSWFKFCDWYLEVAKVNISCGKKLTTLGVLLYVLETLLKILHPIVPFFTEHIYQNIKHLLVEPKETILYETYSQQVMYTKEINKYEMFDLIKNIISEIRTIRNEFKVKSNLKPDIIIVVDNSSVEELIQNYSIYIQRLAYVQHIQVVNRTSTLFTKPKHSSSTVLTSKTGTVEVYVLLENIIDFEKEQQRLKKEIEETEKFISEINKKLNNQEFQTKAPESEVNKVKEKYQLAVQKLNNLKKHLQEIAE